MNIHIGRLLFHIDTLFTRSQYLWLRRIIFTLSRLYFKYSSCDVSLLSDDGKKAECCNIFREEISEGVTSGENGANFWNLGTNNTRDRRQRVSILFTAADDDKFDQDKIFEKALGIRIISELHLSINISCCHYLCLDLYIYYLYCLLHTVHICTFLCTFSLVTKLHFAASVYLNQIKSMSKYFSYCSHFLNL